MSVVDIFSPNAAEAESIVGPGQPQELAERLLQLGAQLVALRMGEEGVLLAGQPHDGANGAGDTVSGELGDMHVLVGCFGVRRRPERAAFGCFSSNVGGRQGGASGHSMTTGPGSLLWGLVVILALLADMLGGDRGHGRCCYLC